MKEYHSRSEEIFYKTEQELIDQLNKLNISYDMPVSIRPSTPDRTTTEFCVSVYYYTRKY